MSGEYRGAEHDAGRDETPSGPSLSRREFVTGAGILGAGAGILGAGAALGALSGCAPASNAATGKSAAGSEDETGAVVLQKPEIERKSIMVGTRKKTELFLHQTKVYDPAKVEYATLDGEPSRNHFFKPVSDEGVKDRIYPDYDAKTFKFLSLSGPSLYPQTYYLFDKDGGTLNPALEPMGYKAVRIVDQGHIKILPNLMVGYYDFAYLTLSILTELWSGNESMNPELWKQGNDYVIVGGSSNGGIWLLAPESVKSLQDLANTRVGIMNPSYNNEALFAKALAEVGLAPESMGGNVAIEMGSPGYVMNDLMADKLSAAFSWSIYTMKLQKEYGYRVLKPWQELGFGSKVLNFALVVRRDILEKHPDVVQKVVQLNYEATQKALKSDEYKKPLDKIYREFQTEYMGHLPAESPGALALDYDVSPDYLRGVVDYMTKAGYFAVPYTYDQLVDRSFIEKLKK